MAGPEDLDAIGNIEGEAYPHPWSREQLLAEITSPLSRFEVCWVDGRLAGYLCYRTVAGEMEILNIATAHSYRRRGVAASLLQHALGQADQGAVTAIWLEVRKDNRAARTLYERFGFYVQGERRRYYRDGEDALLMGRLKLPAP